MPFTFSHPAIVLPLSLLPRKWVSVTGLVIGSLAPDFEKFLKMVPGNTISHAWEGIFWFNLPLGILLCFLFHNVIRNPLINNLPAFLKQRLTSFMAFDWNFHFKSRFGVVVTSILIGATSHICWDSITHRKGLGVKLFPFLSQVVTVAGEKMPLYHFLDLVGSMVGGLFIVGIVMCLPTGQRKLLSGRKWSMYWPVAGLTAIGVVVLRALITLNSEAYWNFIITSISAILIGITVSSFIARYSIK
ncbi:DUF4184 family protein [uncultured Pontibacter sp.]|uniref:DUF4184 family protein n=1 Tax=uncultured Pontibacter sp. TaxID=453356 RepID=UPI002601B173|nr:DUF4184 family protein [uncultured Pontibacter sp.]